jgi:serine/threonine protein kinase
VLQSIGKGGQGEVFLVRDVSSLDKTSESLLKAFPEQLRIAMTNHMTASAPAVREVIGMIRSLAAQEMKPALGALKILLPLDDAVNARTAHERMKAELKALASVPHQNLIRVVDSDVGQRWFVMELMGGRTLGAALEGFRGDVLGSLVALRPVVDALAHLHSKSIVHRDIKPENIFLADRSMVLGDCGLAIKLDHEDRLTETYENAGSRDWMPGWAMGMRLEDVSPAFDVFALGKVLWAMVSGRPKLRLWYHRRPEFSLAKILPASADVEWVQRILDKTVVEHEEDCLANAAAMLTLIDQTIDALRRGAQVPSATRAMKCRFCGLGEYRRDSAPGGYQHHHGFRCSHCGHLEVFRFLESEPPPAWSDERE